MNGCGSRQKWMHECRLMGHKRVGPTLEEAALHIDGEMGALGIEHGFDVLALQPLANFEGLAEQVNLAVGCDLPDEDHAPGRNRQRDERNDEACGQLLQLLPASILLWRQATQAALNVLDIDRVLQPLEFVLEGGDARVVTLQQPWLEPAVEPFHRSVALGPGGRNEDWFDLEAQPHTNHPRQVARSRPPAEVLAGIVELDLLGPAERLPALAQEGQDGLHLARTAEFQAHGAVGGIGAKEK